MAMGLGIIGKKVGMTRIFDDAGQSFPVSVIHVEPNRIAQVKTLETDGYTAVQVTCGSTRPSRLTKPMAGHFAKANIAAGPQVKEFRLADMSDDLKPGAEIKIDQFKTGQLVDVTGTTKGKGFAGGVKRHHFKMQDATHGNSLSHRVLGSTGQCQTPGRVFKGKKMAGQLGHVNRTIQNQEVMRVDTDKQLLLIKGNVPGAPGSAVVIRHAVKAKLAEAA